MEEEGKLSTQTRWPPQISAKRVTVSRVTCAANASCPICDCQLQSGFNTPSSGSRKLPLSLSTLLTCPFVRAAMSTRSTRSRGVTAKAKTASEPAKRGSEGSSRYFKKKSGRGKRTEPDEDEDELAVAGDAEGDGGDGEEGEDGSESETESLHSDALDDEDDDDDAESRRRKNKQALKRKRGSVSSPKKAPAKKAKPASPAKKRKIKKARKDEDEDEESDLELEEGQEIVGVVIQAPKTGRGMCNAFYNMEYAFILSFVTSSAWADFEEYSRFLIGTQET